MLTNTLLALVIILGNPELILHGTKENPQIINLEVKGKDSLVNECIDNGQEIRYRFELKVCENSSFFGSCSPPMVQTRFLSWTPISNAYQLISDLHRDHKLPEGLTFADREEALTALRTIKDLDLGFFKEYQANGDTYLQARAFSECRGEYSKTIAELSYYLSLGLIRLSGFNTGWTNFELNNK